MYEIFDKLMKEKGVRFADIARETGVSYSTFTDWKAGRYTPKDEKMQKIADYFGVSVHYLRTGEQDRQIALDPQPFRDLQRRIDEDAAPGLNDVISMYLTFDENDRKEILALMRIKFDKYRAKANLA